MQLNREDFPSLIQLSKDKPRRERQFETMLALLNKGLDEGTIRNTEMNDVKRYASDLASDSFDEKVNRVFIFNGQYESLPKEVIEFTYSFSIAGIHSLTSIEKRLAKTEIDHPCVDAMRAWLVELMPLNKAVESLKPHVVKGRAPSTGPAKPVNPNKDVKTCACCFRPIAVVSGMMAHHGYKRPGDGEQTNSCPGVRFKPLELSPDGLHYMLKSHQSGKAEAEAKLEKKDAITSFNTTNRKREKVVVLKGEPGFDALLQGYVNSQERDIRWHGEDIANFEERIASWKPEMKHKRVEPEEDSPTP